MLDMCTHTCTCINLGCFRRSTDKRVCYFILCIIKDRRVRENKLKFKAFLQNDINFSLKSQNSITPPIVKTLSTVIGYFKAGFLNKN